MMLLNKNKYAFGLIFSYLLVYYSVIFLFADHENASRIGKAILALSVPVVVVLLQFIGYRNANKTVKPFYFLLAAGSAAYFLAEFLFQLQLFSHLQIDVLSSLLYRFQTLFYLAGFLFVFYVIKNMRQLMLFLTDALIVMVTLSAFGWELVQGGFTIIGSHQEQLLLFAIYPIADILILFAFFAIINVHPYIFHRHALGYLFLAIIVKQVANFSVLITYGNHQTVSHYLSEPLWAIGLLLFGFATLYSDNAIRLPAYEEKYVTYQSSFVNLFVPFLRYGSVLLLLVSFIYNKTNSALFIGLTIVVVLIFIRDLVAILHNQYLVKRLKKFNSQLETMVSERTKELEGKNAQLANAIHNIEYHAKYDRLTDLPNRASFEDTLDTYVEASNDFSILFIDIDRFKHINETLGHQVGDKLLIKIVSRLKASLQAGDYLARHGGDEFTLILSINDATEIEVISTRLLTLIADTYIIDNHEIPVTISIGISRYPMDGSSREDLMKHADIAMYKAKEDGRNRVQRYTDDMKWTLTEKLKLVNRLKLAIANKELMVYYQPQLNIESNHIIGVEALVRWQHPEIGVISPGEFIPLAEEFHHIIQIDDFVLETACEQLMDWHRQGYPLLRLSVNVSVQQFSQQDLIEKLDRVLSKTGFPPEQLVLEITESIAMNDEYFFINKLNEIKALGVSIALDDFGTGYSSLQYLKQLPIDKLKIAREFLRDLSPGGFDYTVLIMMVSLAASLRLSVIAEGIETEEQQAFITSIRCAEGQGYLFSPPLSASIFEEQFLGKVLQSDQV